MARQDLSFRSEKQRPLQPINNRLGNRQLDTSQISFAPSWLLYEAIEEEIRQNWQKAHEVVGVNSLPPDANDIASNVVSRPRTTLKVFFA